MAVKFNVVVITRDIPNSSWDTWIQMGYHDPINYLRTQYKVTEVQSTRRQQNFWREIRFHSRKDYVEFYLKWM